MKNSQRTLHPDHLVDVEVLEFAVEKLVQARSPRHEAVPLGHQLELPALMPESGIGPVAALECLSDSVFAGAAQLYHPGYFAHMDPPTSTVTWAAALWQVAANQNLLHPDAAPAARALETRVIDWLAPFFGMQGGHLVPGSTVSNFTALWAARELRGVRRVVASDKAHLSARKAADILGLAYEAVPANEKHTMSLAERTDLTDAAVVLTAGTVASGAIDDLRATHARWVHIDGAWGGPLRFSHRYRDLLEHIEQADSVGFSAHKWCYQPKGTAAILFRDTDAAHRALSYGGGYLSAPNIGLLGSAPANALPFAASLLAWGRSGLAERIESGMAIATALAEKISADPRFELWAPPTTGVVVWRPRQSTAAAVRDRLTDAWVSLTEIDGEVWLRSVAANTSADPGHVLERVSIALDETLKTSEL